MAEAVSKWRVACVACVARVARVARVAPGRTMKNN